MEYAAAVSQAVPDEINFSWGQIRRNHDFSESQHQTAYINGVLEDLVIWLSLPWQVMWFCLQCVKRSKLDKTSWQTSTSWNIHIVVRRFQYNKIIRYHSSVKSPLLSRCIACWLSVQLGSRSSSAEIPWLVATLGPTTKQSPYPHLPSRRQSSFCLNTELTLSWTPLTSKKSDLITTQQTFHLPSKPFPQQWRKASSNVKALRRLQMHFCQHPKARELRAK